MKTPAVHAAASDARRALVARRLLVVLVATGAIVAAAGLPAPARAQALAPPPATPDVTLDQRLGATLPTALPLRTSDGRAATLAPDGRVLLLVPGYYRCPQLCGLLMHALLEGLHDSGLATRDYRLVRVSLDATETPAIARARREVDLAYARSLGGAPPALELLVGGAPEIAALAQRVGLRFGPGDGVDGARIAHGAVVIVVTPQGRVSRYLTGLRFDPGELREAVADAAHDRVGRWTDRLALLCAHVDPRLGRHSEAVLAGLRGVGLLTLALLAGIAWRYRRASR